MATRFKSCSIAGCKRNAHHDAKGGRGWCNGHYTRWRRYGDPLKGGPDRQRYNKDAICSVEGCEKTVRNSRGWCSDHYLRNREYGDPTGGGTIRGAPMEWIKIHVSFTGDDCLIWPFAKFPSGYGNIRLPSGSNCHVSRLMCEMAHGPAPSDIHEAAHLCGKGSDGCCNPRHLRWATPVENQSDKLVHDTHNRGERHPHVKLTESDVRQIRALKGRVNGREIAERYGVSVSQIYRILRREQWSWLI